MSEQWGGSTPPSTGTSGTSSTASQAKEEAANVAQTASQSGQQVASTAAEQGRKVAGEAAQQARSVLEDARQQIGQQTSSQQQKAAESLRAIADELSTMAENGGSGMGAQLVRQASGQVQQVAGWLENRDPAGVLEEVRSLARRRPGAFLATSAAAGMVVGRLTRATVDERRDTSSGSGGTSSDSGYSSGEHLRGPEYGTVPASAAAPVAGTPAADPYDPTWAAGTGTGGTGYDATVDPLTVDPSAPTDREQWR